MTSLQFHISFGINLNIIRYSKDLNHENTLETGRVSNIRNLSRKFLVADPDYCKENSIEQIDRTKGDWRFRTGSGYAANFGIPPPRHSQRANILYLDGHVGNVKSLTPPNPLVSEPFKYNVPQSRLHLYTY